MLLLNVIENFAYPQDICFNYNRDGWICDGTSAHDCECMSDSKNCKTVQIIPCATLPNSYGCRSGSCICNRDCKNNGRLEQDCQCSCVAPWGGQFCETCMRGDSYCRNGGYINSNCDCTCLYSCSHGTRDSRCNCNCQQGWGGNTCNKCIKDPSDCLNQGTLDTNNCACNCNNSLPCQHNGFKLPNCGCSCIGVWTGSTCNICGLSPSFCVNKGVLNTTLCQCDCTNANKCLNGGSPTATCGCNCELPWIGQTCETCGLPSSYCMNGGSLNVNSCRCNCPTTQCLNGATKNPQCGCDCAGNWSGNYCQTCDLNCHNGNVLNSTLCQCYCPEGTDCSENSNTLKYALIIISTIIGSAMVTTGIYCFCKNRRKNAHQNNYQLFT